MAGLFIARTGDPGFAEARAQFARHVFAGLSEHEFPGWRLLHAPHRQSGPESLLAEGDDLVAVAGTLTCDGLMGRPALRALRDMAELPEPDWSRLGGLFAAFVRRGGRNFLFTDYFGAFPLYHDERGRLFSTSLLAAAAALPRLSFDPQGVYEFAFNVVPVGDDTVFAELKMLGPDRVAEPGIGCHALEKPLPDVTQMPLEERIAAHRDRLMALVSDHVREFGDNVFCPLSGGIDSRLALA